MRRSGVLDLGHAADIAAVDTDVLAGDPARLAQTRVTHTFVNGCEVFSR